MTMFTRRGLIKSAGAAALAAPFINKTALGDTPLKVGYIYLGPVGDYGWTWAHEKGRKEMVKAMGGKVTADYVENVNEDQSAIPVIRDLAKSGHKLIFTTSFGYMDQTITVAKEFPDVKFEHCTGYKRAPNVATYNNRFHEGRAALGVIPGMMSKTGVIGYLGSFKVPEVVMGVDSYTLAAQSVNPNIKVKLVMINSWFDPAKESAAAETLANLGCDVITSHTESPATLQVCEKKKIYGFGQGADMSRFAPHAASDRHSRPLGQVLHHARQGAGRWNLEVGGFLVGRQGWRGQARALQQEPARQREGSLRKGDERLGRRQLRRVHRPDERPVRQGAPGQGRAHGGQGPGGHRLVREGRRGLRRSPARLPLSPHAGRGQGLLSVSAALAEPPLTLALSPCTGSGGGAGAST